MTHDSTASGAHAPLNSENLASLDLAGCVEADPSEHIHDGPSKTQIALIPLVLYNSKQLPLCKSESRTSSNIPNFSSTPPASSSTSSSNSDLSNGAFPPEAAASVGPTTAEEHFKVLGLNETLPTEIPHVGGLPDYASTISSKDMIDGQPVNPDKPGPSSHPLGISSHPFGTSSQEPKAVQHEPEKARRIRTDSTTRPNPMEPIPTSSTRTTCEDAEGAHGHRVQGNHLSENSARQEIKDGWDSMSSIGRFIAVSSVMVTIAAIIFMFTLWRTKAKGNKHHGRRVLVAGILTIMVASGCGMTAARRGLGEVLLTMTGVIVMGIFLGSNIEDVFMPS